MSNLSKILLWCSLLLLVMLANESRARDFSAGPSDSLEFITGGSSRLSILSTGEFVLNDLSPSSALILDASGGVISSTVTSVELGYLEGVTSSIQSQIDSKSESADVVTLATDQTITGGKDFTGRLAMVTTSTASLPCPVMTSTERDALNPVKGDCVFNSTSNALNIYTTAWGAIGGGGAGTTIGYVKDETSSGNNAGSCSAGSWATRTLQTTSGDFGDFGSLSSNVITLDAGTYRVRIKCPAFRVDNHKCKLRNTTDSTDAIIGTTEKSHSSDISGTSSFVEGVITIASSKDFEVQHRCESSMGTTDFGEANSFGVVEVYTQVSIEKE